MTRWLLRTGGLQPVSTAGTYCILSSILTSYSTYETKLRNKEELTQPCVNANQPNFDRWSLTLITESAWKTILRWPQKQTLLSRAMLLLHTVVSCFNIPKYIDCVDTFDTWLTSPLVSISLMTRLHQVLFSSPQLSHDTVPLDWLCWNESTSALASTRVMNEYSYSVKCIKSNRLICFSNSASQLSN